MRKRWTLVLVVLTVAVVLAACGASGGDKEATLTKNRDGFVDINVKQLAEMLKTKDFILVNVHIPYEGQIPGTDLFIPFNEVDSYVDKLPDKNAKIVVYCRSGSMSTIAAKRLVDLGYTNVMELDGGFNAWRAAGYRFEQ